MISNICILYFYDYDIFDMVHNKHLCKVNDDKRVMVTDNDGWWVHSFGKNQIASNKSIVCKWNLNVNCNKGECVIGITDINVDKHDFKVGHDIIWECDGNHCLYFVQDGSIFENKHKWRFWGSKFMRGKVSIKLDLKKKQVSFVVNDKDQGIAYSDVKIGEDITYRLVVALKDEDDFVEIESFQTE